MRNDGTTTVQPTRRLRRFVAASMQVLACVIFVSGVGFLWGLAITDGPDLLDHIMNTEGPPGWLAVKWAAMSAAAALDPWRWYGIGASAVVATVAVLLVVADRLAARAPAGAVLTRGTRRSSVRSGWSVRSSPRMTPPDALRAASGGSPSL